MTEAGRGLEKGHFSEAIAAIEIEVQAIVGPGQDLAPVQIENRIRCYRCREYEHFAKDCPTSGE